MLCRRDEMQLGGRVCKTSERSTNGGCGLAAVRAAEARVFAL